MTLKSKIPSKINLVSKKTLVIIIHGGHSTGERNDDQIQVREIRKNTFSKDKGQPIWTESLDNFLDANKFFVLGPQFPNGHDFVYTEEERFMKQLLNSEICREYQQLILVSHSMGTIFLQNFLAKFNINEVFGFHLKQIHFVSPTRDFGDFKINSNWSNITSQIDPKNIFIYHSKDDQKCDFEDGQYYNSNLPNSNFISFDNRGHFTQPEFPELVTNLERSAVGN